MKTPVLATTIAESGHLRGWRPSVIESTSIASAPFGPAAHIAVERALAEFRSGRPVVIDSRSGSTAVLPIDGMTDARLAAFRQLCAPSQVHVVVTASRARALGLEATGPVGLVLPENANFAVSTNWGGFGSESALAIGGAARLTDNLYFSGGGAFASGGRSSGGGRAGVTFAW